MDAFQHLNLPLTRYNYVRSSRGFLTLVPYSPAPAYKVECVLHGGLASIHSLVVTDFERAGPLWEDPLVMRFYEQNLKQIDPFMEPWPGLSIPFYEAALSGLEFWNDTDFRWDPRPDLNMHFNLQLEHTAAFSSYYSLCRERPTAKCSHSIYFKINSLTLDPPK